MRNKRQDLSWASDADRNDSGPPRLVAYLRSILEKYEESAFIKYLVTPSPIALSGLFDCSQDDIRDALTELQSQGYEYETDGGVSPITLWNPLIRRKPSG